MVTRPMEGTPRHGSEEYVLIYECADAGENLTKDANSCDFRASVSHTLTVVSTPPAARNAVVISAAAASFRLRTASVTSSTRLPVLSRPKAASFTQISVTTP